MKRCDLTFRRSSGFRKKNGISEIVSVLLLILITVSIASLLLAFTTSALGLQSSNFGNIITGSGQSLSDHMTVEQVQFTGLNGTLASGNATIYLRNDGPTQIFVSRMYILFAANNSVITYFSYSPLVSISQGSFVALTAAYVYSSEVPYTFLIVAQDGSKVSVNAMA